jgi:hypothetical protein
VVGLDEPGAVVPVVPPGDAGVGVSVPVPPGAAGGAACVNI